MLAKNETPATTRRATPIAVSDVFFWRIADDSKLCRFWSASIWAAEPGSMRRNFAVADAKTNPNASVATDQTARVPAREMICAAYRTTSIVCEHRRDARQKGLDHHDSVHRVAYSLGIPTIRVNTGRGARRAVSMN